MSPITIRLLKAILIFHRFFLLRCKCSLTPLPPQCTTLQTEYKQLQTATGPCLSLNGTCFCTPANWNFILSVNATLNDCGNKLGPNDTRVDYAMKGAASGIHDAADACSRLGYNGLVKPTGFYTTTKISDEGMETTT
ncbi:hypothetical protein BCR33DRAFT_719157, partial [Rhizoclosmatium globosum]